MTHSFARLTLPLLTAAALLCGQAHAQTTPMTRADAVNADTIMVQQGDTAYSISRRAGLSVEAFLILNGLSSPDLKVGQTVIIRSGIPPYVVQPGDTLYSLARKYGLSVDALKAANELPQDGTIAVGQSLRIPTPGSTIVTRAAPAVPVVAQAAPQPAPEPAPMLPSLALNSWRDAAMSLLGTPYVYGGTTRRGIDCSGLVLQVFTPLGIKLPRVSADQARMGSPVDVNSLQAGDLVFFDTVGGGRVTHVGIYLGNDTFINANSYRGQVTVDKLLSDKYWAPRYLGARRVLPGTILASRP